MVQVSYRFLLVLLFFHGISITTTTSLGSKNCEYQSNCGVILDIKPPFRFKDDSRNCGDPNFELFCNNNRTILGSSFDTLFVESIDYQQRRIHATFTGLFKGNCSSFPKSSYEIYYGPYISLMSNLTYSPVFILICRSPVGSPYYVDTAPCITAKNIPNSILYSGEENLYSYAVIGNALVASDIEDSCTVIYKWILSPMMLVFNSSSISFVDIHDQMASGIDFSYSLPDTNIIFAILRILANAVVFGMLGRTLIGTILLIIFVIYKCKRRHQSEYDNIEQFLRGPNNLLPLRYSYTEIKQMTNNFRDKLGKGGYGDVYKGKTRSGYLVAVKMLNEAKGSGQDFINEVATIGRIYHLNVVRLVGFCITSSKRALVYDYMPNGSLDKFIFSSEHPNGLAVPLSWERTLEIAIGVARGISYLHHGCHMQILHFDIKPHNILLDDKFVPKVSDFGLAKLCPSGRSSSPVIDIPLAGFILDDGSSACCCWATHNRAATLLRIHSEACTVTSRRPHTTVIDKSYGSTISRLNRILQQHGRVIVENHGSMHDFSALNLTFYVGSEEILHRSDKDFLRMLIVNACSSTVWSIVGTPMDSNALRWLQQELTELGMAMLPFQHIYTNGVNHIDPLSESRQRIQELLNNS